jgi:hypothetical protein
MKYLLLLLFSVNCWAATEYTFVYHVREGRKDMTFKYKVKANTWKEAFDIGGAFCGDFFGVGKKDLDEDQIAEITSGCGNPYEP